MFVGSCDSNITLDQIVGEQFYVLTSRVRLLSRISLDQLSNNISHNVVLPSQHSNPIVNYYSQINDKNQFPKLNDAGVHIQISFFFAFLPIFQFNLIREKRSNKKNTENEEKNKKHTL
jgi:hypothetical protein